MIRDRIASGADTPPASAFAVAADGLGNTLRGPMDPAGRMSPFQIYIGATTASGLAPLWGDIDPQDGTVGEVYIYQWDMPLADRPVTYSLQSGSLPPGLFLTPLGDSHGCKLNGTPTTAGSYTFTLRANNSIGHDDKAFTLIIAPVSGGGGISYAFVC